MKERISRKTFVRLGALLGVGTAGASVLAACQGSSGGESGSGGANGESSGGYDGNARHRGSSGPSSRKTFSRAEKQASGGHGDATGGGDSTRTSGKKTGGRAEKQALDRRAIAQVAEMRPGTAMKFEDLGGNPAVLVRLKRGNFVAYSAICTHEGCTVAFRNGQLACPCHGSVFDPASNARVVNGPAQRPLPKMPVEVRGGEVVRA